MNLEFARRRSIDVVEILHVTHEQEYCEMGIILENHSIFLGIFHSLPYVSHLKW